MDSQKISNQQILAFIKGCIESVGIKTKCVDNEKLSSVHFLHGEEWYRAVAYKDENAVFVYDQGNGNSLPLLIYKECGLYYFPFDFVRTEIFKLLGHYKDFEYKQS